MLDALVAKRIAGFVPAWITIPDIWKAFDFILGPYVDTKNCAMSWCCKRLIPHAVVHLKKGPISEVWISCHLNLTWRRAPCRKFWVSCQNVGDGVFKFRSPIPRIDFPIMVPQMVPQALPSCDFIFHSSMKFLRQVQVQMLDQRVEDPSECCKDTSINVNIVPEISTCSRCKQVSYFHLESCPASLNH